MNRWILTEETRTKFKPILQQYLEKVENLTDEQVESMSNEELGIDLSCTDINPSQLVDLLEELGYKETNTDDNAWDFWIYMKRKDGKVFDSACEDLVIAGCGMTFELKIWIEGMDF